METEVKRYRVTLRSAPGMWARYEGYVDVVAREDEDIAAKACAKLRRTAFPDRPASAWVIATIALKG